MDTLHTVLKRGCSIWDRTRVPEEELHRRLERVRAGMQERAVDLLLVYGDSWKFGHLAYVSHFIPKNRGALALIPLQGDPALVIQEPSRNNPFSSTLTWIHDVHSVGKFAQGVSEAIKSRGLKPKKVGLGAVKEQLNIREWRELEKFFENVEWCDMGAYLSSLRLVKSAVELALLRETTRILEEALARFEQIAAPGRKEYQIMADVEHEARRRGVEDFRLLLARSAHPKVGLRPPADSALQKGEAILILIAASYQRYWAELGQTFCFGRPCEKITEDYGLASRVFRRLTEETRGGDSPTTMAKCLSEISSPRVRESFRAYGFGNGTGLDLDEEPYLGRDGNGAIEHGMVLTLRSCFTGEDAGSALISRPYLVTVSGLEPLSRMKETLMTIGD